MATKTILLVSLLAAVAVAKPTTVREDHFKDFNICKLKNIWTVLAPSEKDNTLKPTVQLMKVIMFDLQNLGLSYARRAKDISDGLVNDAVFSTNKSPAVVAFKHEIEEYQDKYESCGEMEELFDLVDFYSNATSVYYEKHDKGTLDADSKVIYDVLKKYSPKDLDEEFEHEFVNTFVTKVGQKINDVKESLKKEEGGLGVKILQWWDKTKALKSTEEKVEAFKEYMKLYGVTDE